MAMDGLTYDADRDCYVPAQPNPTETRRVYGTHDERLKIETVRETDLRSGVVSEHSVCRVSLSAAGPILTDEDPSEGMARYHEFEGVGDI